MIIKCFSILDCAPIFHAYRRYPLRRRLLEPLETDYFYEDQSSRQMELETNLELSIAERVSVAITTLSIVGLSYLSSRTDASNLQVQVDELRLQLRNLQYSVNSMQNSISSLSASTSAPSSVLESTCNTLKTITSTGGTVSTIRDIQTYLRTLILIDDPICS